MKALQTFFSRKTVFAHETLAVGLEEERPSLHLGSGESSNRSDRPYEGKTITLPYQLGL